MVIYEEMIGDRLIQVLRLSSYYHLLVNGQESGRYHGKEAAGIALRAERNRIYGEIEKLPTPPRISPLACKLIAWSVSDYATLAGMSAAELADKEPALRQLHIEAMQKEAVKVAIFRAAAYSTAIVRTRKPVSEEQIRFIMALQPTDRWKMPKGWRSYYERLKRYAEVSLKNMATEGGVNATWSR